MNDSEPLSNEHASQGSLRSNPPIHSTTPKLSDSKNGRIVSEVMGGNFTEVNIPEI